MQILWVGKKTKEVIKIKPLDNYFLVQSFNTSFFFLNLMFLITVFEKQNELKKLEMTTFSRHENGRETN